jgi:hypothetical protein
MACCDGGCGRSQGSYRQYPVLAPKAATPPARTSVEPGLNTEQRRAESLRRQAIRKALRGR